jgi:putative DNA primase/helicase
MDLLVQAAKQIGNVRLLIVDPIVSAFIGDGHKANDVRRGLQPLVDLAQVIDCAVLGITHFSKGSSGRDPLERVMGSQAFGALARVVMIAAKDSNSEDGGPPRRFLARAKSNIGPEGDGFDCQLLETKLEMHQDVVATYIVWQGPIQGSARELLDAVELDDASGADSSERNDAKMFLKSMLADGPVSVRSIKADSGNARYQSKTHPPASGCLNVPVGLVVDISHSDAKPTFATLYLLVC